MIRWTYALHLLACVGSGALWACGERQALAAPPAHQPAHVDSIIPREEALRRFQAAAGRPAKRLEEGADSRDELVRAFVAALAGRDTAAFHRLALDRSEFAFLYYPTAPQSRPPYELPPELLWFMLQSGSERGLARALAERGGQPLVLDGYSCDGSASREGENLVWGPCVVRYRRDGVRMEERLFGLIVERGGRFKFLNYGNKL